MVAQNVHPLHKEFQVMEVKAFVVFNIVKHAKILQIVQEAHVQAEIYGFQV